MAYMMVIFGVVRVRHIGGQSTIVWIALGLVAFYMFSRVGNQTANGLSANKALFAYRQVKPLDPVLVRSGLEGFLMVILIIVLAFGVGLSGQLTNPSLPLELMGVLAGLWFLGVGYGLVLSVCSDLLPEFGRLIKLLSMPLLLVSGVLFPLSMLSQPYRGWLMLNPIAHGVEGVRAAYATSYYAVPELDVQYMWLFALVLVFLGMALHVRFEERLASE